VGLWTALAIFLISLTPSIQDFSFMMLTILVALIPAGILWGYNYLELNSIRYYFLKKDFHTQTGFFSRYTKSSPYENIRDILISQSLYIRIVGLGELSLETGKFDDYVSDSDSRSQPYALKLQRSIPALSISDAYSLRDDFFRILKLKTNFLSPSLVEKFPLLNVKPIKKWVGWVIGGVVLWFLVVAQSYFNELSIPPWGIYFAVIICVLLAAKLVHEYAYWKVYYYNASSDILVIRKGVFHRKEIAIPFSKIENIYLDQDVFDRAFGLWDLHFETPTLRSSMEAHIDGLSEKDGMTLRDMLLKQIKQ